MREWLERILRFKESVRRIVIRRKMRRIANLQREIEIAQDNLAIQYEELKEAKINGAPEKIHHLEADIPEMEATIKRRQVRQRELQDQLNRLDPDGSIRASLPPD